MPELRLAPVEVAQLEAVATLHARAFPDAAITAFGPEVVRRYYAWLVEGPHDAIVMGAWRGPALVGFCAAGVFRGAMNGFLRRNRRYLVRHVLLHPRLLVSPLIRDRVVTAARITLRYSSLAPRNPPGPPSFGVLSIATEPASRGTGAGAALLAEAETRARSAGHARMTLTVHPENVHAVAYYERRGWLRDPAQRPWVGAMYRVLG